MTFFALFLIVCVHIYLPWRLNTLLSLENKVLLYVLFFVATVLGLTSIFLITKYEHILISLCYNVFATWLGVLLILSFFMALFEIINLLYPLPRLAAGCAVIALTTIVSIYAVINAFSFKVYEVSIPIKNLENDVKIVQISDVHLGISANKEYLAKIVKKTNELKPDFVVITGDLADSKPALNTGMFTPLKDLPSPVYFVSGNHDAYAGLDAVVKNLEENEVIVMQNSVAITHGVKLIGLNYMRADDNVYDPHQVSNETVKDILPTLDLSGNNPKVVLHHGPWGVEYMSENNIDAVFSGHTHAGQIFPLNLIASIMFPYVAGLTKYNQTYIYVSQGIGTFIPKMRLGTDNEISLITLKREQ